VTARYYLYPRARTDLDQVWSYSVKNWGDERAELYLRELQKALEMLAAHPRLGRACDDIRPGYFKMPVGSHVVFYKLGQARIDVVRILHGRMDFDRHL
jgi:toxin ParE1/3/4